jgi:demethylmenaquinone methyltransferase/2-methoxy-6-polyprenyl-1,4-benzoquinol methylase
VIRDDPSGRLEAARLQSLDLEAHLADPGMKQRFVTPMFDVIAPRYDRFTRIFSFGMDRGWKRELLAAVGRAAPPNARVLDLACGTGDLALDVARLLPGASVTGLDVSAAMIALAEARRAESRADRVRFAVGDMSRLDLPDSSVDVITAGYAFRNVPDHTAALAEAARVLRPGGHLFTLDFYRPRNAMWRSLFVGYLTVAGSIIGWLWHRAPVVYAYLGPSVDHFVSWQAFSRSLEGAGLVVDGVRTKLLGGIAIHEAGKLA